MKKLLRLSPYLLVILCWLGLRMGSGWSWLGLPIIFGLHPLLDQLTKNHIDSNDGPKHSKYLEGTLLAFPLFITLFFVDGFSLFLAEERLWVNLGQIFVTGLAFSALGITVAHEFIHRKENLLRAVGVYLLALVNYTWFRIAHIFIHHKHVATPGDPSTAELDENLYPFLWRSLHGSIKKSYLFEKNRVKNMKSPFLANRLHHYLFISVIYFSLMTFLFGLKGFLFVLGISLVGNILTETVNYIEHYGLRRNLLPNGKYEPVHEIHSWDSDFAVTNFSLFNLGKHSHHHAKARDHFQDLLNEKDNPVLPMGYSAAILLAYFPPLWKSVMNPLVLARQN